MDAAYDGLGALTLFVEDVAAAAAFYRDVLDLPQIHRDEVSTVFRLGGILVNVLAVGAAKDLIEPVMAAAGRGTAQMMLSSWVEDVDSTCANLTRRGVTLLNGPTDRPWGKRTAAFSDPGGTVWEVAQDISAATE